MDKNRTGHGLFKVFEQLNDRINLILAHHLAFETPEKQ